MSMLRRERLRRILEIAVPIILALLSQTVLNLVDTAMVRHLGNAALAAVGIASFANFVASAPIMGLASGVQAMAARRIGEGRVDQAAWPLNGGLLVCLGFGIPWVTLFALSAGLWFPLLAHDPAVSDVGLPYLLCRLAAAVLVGMHFSFRAFWNATGRSTFYMVTLVGMHAINVGLNWLLIYGRWGFPKLGVTGAGVANAMAALLGVSAHVILAAKVARAQGFAHGIPERETMRTMLRISVPSSLQQLFFALGMTALMALLARVGTEATAASKVLMDLLLAGLLPALGFGLAGTTLVSEALGRKDMADARAWGVEVMLVAVTVVACAGLPVALFPDWVLGGFLRDASTIALARAPLRLVACTVGLDAVALVLQNCLLGAGDSRRVMIAALTLQWGLFLPIAALCVLVLHAGMLEVWWLHAGYRLAQACVFAFLWRGQRWTSLHV